MTEKRQDGARRGRWTDRLGGGVSSGSRLLRCSRRRAVRKLGTLATAGSGAVAAAGKARARSFSVPTLEPRPYRPVKASRDFPTGADEIVVFCGGYGTNPITWDPEYQAAKASDALEHDADVSTDVVAYDYDLLGSYWSAKAEAGALGVGLGDWIDDYLASHPDTAIRLLGHSLGVQVVVHCLDRMTETVAAAGSLLGGVATTAVTAGGEWYDAIANHCEQFNNYYDREDLVSPSWALVEFAEPLARDPAEGTEPPNYEDHDVTDEVDNHLSAFESCDGCMDVAAAEWGYDVPEENGCSDGWWW